MHDRTIDRWPRVRTRRSGSVVVSGWHTEQWRFAVMFLCCRVLVRLVAVLLLVVSALPFAAPVLNLVPEGTPLYGYVWAVARALAEIRLGAVDGLLESAPGVCQTLLISRDAVFVWPFAVFGIIVYRLDRHMASPLARVLGLLAPFLVKRPFRIRISDRSVRFIRWGVPRWYSRRGGIPIQFMAEQDKPGLTHKRWREETYRAVMRYGHRTVVIAQCMHERDARRLALGLSHARDRVDGTPTTFMPDMGVPFAM